MAIIVRPYNEAALPNSTRDGQAGERGEYARGDHTHAREPCVSHPVGGTVETLSISSLSTTLLYVTPIELPGPMKVKSARLYKQQARLNSDGTAALADIRFALYSGDGTFLFDWAVFFQEVAGLQVRHLSTARELGPGLYFEAVTFSAGSPPAGGTACVVDAFPRQRNSPIRGTVSYAGGATFPASFDPWALTQDNLNHPYVSLSEA